MSLEQDLERYRNLLEPELLRWVRAQDAAPTLRDAMEYSLMAGGKRVRPALVFAAAEALGRPATEALPAALALEMIHTYSLIHDDLPAMDDDDLRRGKPTCHKKFGEATAILAGDGLLTLAFETLADASWPLPADARLKALTIVARGAGAMGMVAGQVLDLEFEGKPCEERDLEKIHTHKTGKLLSASVLAGAACIGASSVDFERLSTYGRAMGLAFQIADDVLDLTATTQELGKDAKSDLKKHKATYPSVIGMDRSRARAAQLLDEALAAIRPFEGNAAALASLARYIVERRS